ncbi:MULTISPECIES: hypothetical protein [Enterobacter]|uniref:hypothetical protein n=1 Tax=Enterobacter TaxID=547 RepID=UPI0007E5155F|nr:MULTISPECIES: hypothetical protein [Enterobacter]MCS3488142.1 hypothetical protein [Enterobacter sp. SLBN-59]OAY17826.1 hypothetical protein AXY04_13370 [Enterobacter asburiae]
MNKNYAGMAEPKNGDCVMLGLEIGPHATVKYLGDFSGGKAGFTDGRSGFNATYKLVGEPGENEIRLYSGDKLEYCLHGSRAAQPQKDSNGFSFYPDLPLAVGQTLRLTHVSNTFVSIELRLNSLYN